MDSGLTEKFPPQTVEKVNRLFDLLYELGKHPNLRGKFAMHGGTALNLFVFDIPRLSVDIDLSYIGAISREEMLKERPFVEKAISDVARSQGYMVTSTTGGHAGKTFVLNYCSSFGRNNIKVDFVYLNRSPLLPVKNRVSRFRSDVQVPLFDRAELIGGKTKAFFERVKVRDLYDIANCKRTLDVDNQESNRVLHKIILFYATLSANFPYGFVGREKRFETLHKEFNEQLIPMLRLQEIHPKLEELIVEAREYINGYVLPQDEGEEEFLFSFAKGEFFPELLFGENEIAKAASWSPEAMWKLQNLKKITR